MLEQPSALTVFQVGSPICGAYVPVAASGLSPSIPFSGTVHIRLDTRQDLTERSEASICLLPQRSNQANGECASMSMKSSPKVRASRAMDQYICWEPTRPWREKRLGRYLVAVVPKGAFILRKPVFRRSPVQPLTQPAPRSHTQGRPIALHIVPCSADIGLSRLRSMTHCKGGPGDDSRAEGGYAVEDHRDTGARLSLAIATLGQCGWVTRSE